jgi:hypothetical protein
VSKKEDLIKSIPSDTLVQILGQAIAQVRSDRMKLDISRKTLARDIHTRVHQAPSSPQKNTQPLSLPTEDDILTWAHTLPSETIWNFDAGQESDALTDLQGKIPLAYQAILDTSLALDASLQAVPADRYYIP